ncbi:MAG: hypothetical protein ACI9MR_003291, partial [Myxococcota bacterium]
TFATQGAVEILQSDEWRPFPRRGQCDRFNSRAFNHTLKR